MPSDEPKIFGLNLPSLEYTFLYLYQRSEASET